MKQVIIVDKSLKMPPGKMATQVAHASVSCYIESEEQARSLWVNDGMPKVVLKTDSIEILKATEQVAKNNGLVTCLIEDNGKTVFSTPTITCLGIGPSDDNQINEITSNLKLY